MRIYIRLTLAFVFMFAMLGTASAQTSSNGQTSPFGAPDNRFDGYPSRYIQWPTGTPTETQIAKCASDPLYTVRFNTFTKYAKNLKIAGTRETKTEECRWTLVQGGYALVRLPVGTFIVQDEQHRDLALMGSTKGGIVCYNPSPFGIAVNVPVAPPAPAPPAPTPVVVEAPPAPAPPTRVAAVETAPPAPPTPTYRTTYNHSDAHLSGSIGHSNGNVHTDYIYPNPKGGDVPQKHVNNAWVVGIRFDQADDHGIFAEGTFTIAPHAKNQLYQDLQGNWLTKKRDTEHDSDPEYNLAGGYKFRIGENIGIGPRVDYNHTCLKEKYNAQNTDTDNERCFQTLGIGAEASGSTSSVTHKVTTRVVATLGVNGKRKKDTTQVYNGPPVINFPAVIDDPQNAKLNRLSGEVEVGIAKHISAFGNVSYSSWGSSRPTSNPATKETTKMTKVVVGVKIGF